MSQERTFVMIKPDAVHRGLIGEVIARFERKGLRLVAMKMIWLDQVVAGKHYAIHKGKSFYNRLIEFITSGPVIVMAWEGYHAISIVRTIVGATSPDEAHAGTIRGDYVINITSNVVHASDSPETAVQELGLYFTPGELHDYHLCLSRWLEKTD